ncbi:VF530 family protein [Catenovulum sp. 2E275]|uniref:VF530 family protein n=1 Tax=Catenovulum sp. 2E275 TaxID=2980497 RepID=UPI0021D27E95|nr:VF530 family protein [Catenovulum sp. 2E275]MCU4674202.1 VF530 family protein [Catenovulum sp. 2E275]
MANEHLDPLNGITLEKMLVALNNELGWQLMHQSVQINCFSNDPSIKSSLKFLRKTPWARAKVEELYLTTFHPYYQSNKK